MKLKIFDTRQELDWSGARLVRDVIVQKNPFHLGLSTGETPIGLYHELVQCYRDRELTFRHVYTYNLDEYIGLDRQHPQSYFYFMKHHLFDHIDLPNEHINIPDGMARDLDEECSRYNRILDDIIQLDLLILGIGHNGHIGFNEPGDSLSAGTHVATLSNETRHANARFFNGIDEVPEKAVTMGIGHMLKAKRILLIAKGKQKASVVHEALTGPITTYNPGSLLQTHPHLTVYLDKHAAQFFL